MCLRLKIIELQLDIYTLALLKRTKLAGTRCLFTGWPVKLGRVFLVPCKKWLVQYTLVQKHTLDKSLFTRYQKNTAMFIWSGCTSWPASCWSPARRTGSSGPGRRWKPSWGRNFSWKPAWGGNFIWKPSLGVNFSLKPSRGGNFNLNSSWWKL